RKSFPGKRNRDSQGLPRQKRFRFSQSLRRPDKQNLPAGLRERLSRPVLFEPRRFLVRFVRGLPLRLLQTIDCREIARRFSPVALPSFITDAISRRAVNSRQEHRSRG